MTLRFCIELWPVLLGSVWKMPTKHPHASLDFWLEFTPRHASPISVTDAWQVKHGILYTPWLMSRGMTVLILFACMVMIPLALSEELLKESLPM